jgi:hypothetical protein
MGFPADWWDGWPRISRGNAPPRTGASRASRLPC